MEEQVFELNDIIQQKDEEIMNLNEIIQQSAYLITEFRDTQPSSLSLSDEDPE
jgi:hypothetical protein